MNGKQLIVSATVGALLLAGCDSKPKASSSSQPTRSSSTSVVLSQHTGDSQPDPTAVAPTSADVPTSRPVESPHSTFFIAEGHGLPPVAFDFPRAKLRIDRDQKAAVLYSDDPKTAIDSKYQGNGYYLVIQLTDDVLQHLDRYQWHFKAPSSEYQDSADGIFREGLRYHLQPSDVTVTFSGEAPLVNVTVEGTFSQFDMKQSIREGSLVEVKGLIAAMVDPAK